MQNLTVFLASSVAAVMMSSAAFSADLTTEEVPMAAEVVTATTYDWNGAYIGISGGYVDPNMDIRFGGTNLSYGDNGYLVGGTIGYNYQIGKVVAGIEGDLSYADIEGTSGDLFGFGPAFGGSAEASYLGTIRGRLGYAFDRVLVFGTAGVAFTDLDVSTAAGDINENLTGYTVGGGVEYGITDNLTTKIEYLYADFGSEDTTLFPGNVTTDLDMHIVRVGLNFKF